MKSFKQEKSLWSIREVAKMFQVNATLLRYWEKEFESIRPDRSEKGTRQYNEENLKAIRSVYRLVKEQGLTIAGAKQKLKNDKKTLVKTDDIVYLLKSVRSELLAMKEEVEEMEKTLL